MVQSNFCTSCGDRVGEARLKKCVGVTVSEESKVGEGEGCKARVCFSTAKGQIGCIRLSDASSPFRCQPCSKKMGVPMAIVSNSIHFPF